MGPTTRLTVPMVAVSLLLLGTGVGAAWYVQRLQSSVSALLSENVASVRAAQELEISIREVRTQFTRYLATGDRKYLERVPRLRDQTVRLLEAVEGLASTAPEQELVRRIHAGLNRFYQEFDALSSGPPPADVYGPITEAIDAVLVQEIFEPAHEYLKLNEGMLQQSAEMNAALSERLALALTGLGVCGAVGGVLAGWALAASLRRSLEQTHERLLDTAERLSRAAGPAPSASASAEDAWQSVRASVSAILERLRQTQRDALRAEQLAVVGQMAAGIAHEVRNPLMTIKLLVQAAETRGFRSTDLRVLEGEIGRLERTITDFLDFARPARLQPQRVEVGSLVAEVVEGLRPRAELQGVTLESNIPEEPLETAADPGQLRQVLVNLGLNALDELPCGGAVRLSCEGAADGELVLTVADTGPGLPSGLEERIFEPFVSTKESGTGLGLSICRRIVEAHSGRIEAENQPQGGAVFRVRLPAVAPALAGTNGCRRS